MYMTRAWLGSTTSASKPPLGSVGTMSPTARRLPLGPDLEGALALHVHPVVAVPAAAPVAHLGEPGPDRTGRRVDDDAPGDHAGRLGDEIVAGQGAGRVRRVDAPGPIGRSTAMAPAHVASPIPAPMRMVFASRFTSAVDACADRGSAATSAEGPVGAVGSVPAAARARGALGGRRPGRVVGQGELRSARGRASRRRR